VPFPPWCRERGNNNLSIRSVSKADFSKAEDTGPAEPVRDQYAMGLTLDMRKNMKERGSRRPGLIKNFRQSSGRRNSTIKSRNRQDGARRGRRKVGRGGLSRRVKREGEADDRHPQSRGGNRQFPADHQYGVEEGKIQVLSKRPKLGEDEGGFMSRPRGEVPLIAG